MSAKVTPAKWARKREGDLLIQRFESSALLHGQISTVRQIPVTTGTRKISRRTETQFSNYFCQAVLRCEEHALSFSEEV
ncbi:MAG TPA: hypothetical protein VF555_25115 [Variovorax sp.]